LHKNYGNDNNNNNNNIIICGITECFLNVTLEPNTAESNMLFLPHSGGIFFFENV